MRPPLIVHHANCPDGFGSAWLLGRALGEHDKHAANYGQPFDIELAADRDVYLVDFCFPSALLDDIADVTDQLLVLDHHETAVGYVDGATMHRHPNVAALRYQGGMGRDAVIDQSRSGVGIVSEYVRLIHGSDVSIPDWFHHVEARDLWKRTPEVDMVFAAVTSWPYTDDAWDYLASLTVDQLCAQGQVVEQYRQRLIEQIVDTAFQIWIDGYLVWIAGSPYAVGSDVAGILAQREPSLFGAYYVDYGTHVKMGLRSTSAGMNVAELAAKWPGGGGHPHAAGFEVPKFGVTELTPPRQA